jgi:hypothetical protein
MRHTHGWIIVYRVRHHHHGQNFDDMSKIRRKIWDGWIPIRVVLAANETRANVEAQYLVSWPTMIKRQKTLGNAGLTLASGL